MVCFVTEHIIQVGSGYSYQEMDYMIASSGLQAGLGQGVPLLLYSI